MVCQLGVSEGGVGNEVRLTEWEDCEEVLDFGEKEGF